MGHAGAIISGGSGTAADKIKALNKVGITVAGSPTEIPALLVDAMKGKKSPTKKKAAPKKKAAAQKQAAPKKKSANKTAKKK
jgi:hypothetical protein